MSTYIHTHTQVERGAKRRGQTRVLKNMEEKRNENKPQGNSREKGMYKKGGGRGEVLALALESYTGEVRQSKKRSR